jgi:hypothetical protein
LVVDSPDLGIEIAHVLVRQLLLNIILIVDYFLIIDSNYIWIRILDQHPATLVTGSLKLLRILAIRGEWHEPFLPVVLSCHFWGLLELMFQNSIFKHASLRTRCISGQML